MDDDLITSLTKLITQKKNMMLLLVILLLSIYVLVRKMRRRAVNLADKCVLITGAGMGIGREMALQFAEHGACLILWDINKEAVDKVAIEVKAIHAKRLNHNDYSNNNSNTYHDKYKENKNGGTTTERRKNHAKSTSSSSSSSLKFVFSVQCDVSSRESVSKATKLSKAFAQEARSTNIALSGTIDVLINNAGIVNGKLFKDLTSADVERTHGVNYFGNVWTLQEILPDMIARKAGHVVTISSLMGLLPGAGLSDYCASKFATVGLAQCLRLEMQKLTGGKVSTSLICPYAIATGMFHGISINYQWLFPLLQPTFVAMKVVDAVRFKEEMVILPWTVSIVVKFLPLMPDFVRDIIYEQCGALNGMDSFQGRGKRS